MHLLFCGFIKHINCTPAANRKWPDGSHNFKKYETNRKMKDFLQSV